MKFDKYKRIKKKRERSILRLPEHKLDMTLKRSLSQSFYEEHPDAPRFQVLLREANRLMAKEGKIKIKELPAGTEVDWSSYESSDHYKEDLIKTVLYLMDQF